MALITICSLHPARSGVLPVIMKNCINSRHIALQLAAMTLLLVEVFRHRIILHPDFHNYIYLAERIKLFSPSTWLGDPLHYPLGFPALLHLLAELFGGYWMAGKLLTAFFGALFLYMAWRCLCLWHRACLGALFGVALIVCHPGMREWLSTPGTDLPFSACALTGMYYLLQDSSTRRRFLLAGIWFGAAYMFRFTALALFVGGFLVIAWEARGRFSSQLWRQTLAFAGGFLLLSLPQTLPTLFIHGNPLYNLQGQNFAFYVFGEGDWSRFSTYLEQHSSFLSVFAQDPSRCIAHWLRNLKQVPLGPALLPALGMILFYFGAVIIATDTIKRKPKYWRPWLAALPLYFAGTLLIAPATRYFLWVLPAVVIPVQVALESISSALKLKKGLQITAAALLVVGLLIFWRAPAEHDRSELALQVTQVADVLRAQHGYRANLVCGVSGYFYDPNERNLQVYLTPMRHEMYRGMGPKQLVELMRKGGERFFIYDSMGGTLYYPGLLSLAKRDNVVPGLKRLYRNQAPFVAVYERTGATQNSQ
jgi:Dolichyl-phosphate-mannose-protein mannosyltransferase